MYIFFLKQYPNRIVFFKRRNEDCNIVYHQKNSYSHDQSITVVILQYFLEEMRVSILSLYFSVSVDLSFGFL